MASSQDPDGDDTNSGEITLPSSQHLMSPGDIEAFVNALTMPQRVLQLTPEMLQMATGTSRPGTLDSAEQPQLTPEMFQMAAGASRPGSLDSETLKLKLTEAQKSFVPTNVFKDIRHSLEKNCHVTICGASGEGKTTMALMLGQKYRKQGYELVFVDRPDKFDLGSCIRSGQKICLIFDDVFGSVGRSTDLIDVQRLCDSLKIHIDNNIQTRLTDKIDKKKQGSEKLKNDKKHFKSNEIRVIFTSKTYDFKEGISKMRRQHISIFTKSVVDLTVNPRSSYSHQEKKAMFQKHREMNPQKMLGELQVEDVIKQDSPHLFGFPLTCRLFFEYFAKEDNEQKEKAEREKDKSKAIDFFSRPIYYLRIELNDILSRRNDQSAALILVMLCEGNLKLPDLESPNRNEKVDEMLGHISRYTNSATRSGFADAAKSFRGTFFSRGDNFCFAHSSIYEACACALYQFNPTLVLENCSLDFLNERLKAKPGIVQESGVSDLCHFLFVSEEYFPLVVTRFVSAMKEGNFSKTVAHPIMQSKLFVNQFLKEIRQLASDDKVWVKLKEGEKGFLFWVVKSKSTYLVENIGKSLQITFSQDDIREALSASVECDCLDLYKLLMDRLKGEIDEADLNKHLLASAKGSGEKMVKYLLDVGANISSINTAKQTILHILCTYNRPDILELVMAHSNKKDLNMALNTLDDNESTPLMFAALQGTLECFQVFKSEVNPVLFEEADVSLVAEDGYTLLHLACIGGNKHIVESVLTPRNINSRNKNGWTPIMVAAALARSEVCYLLLSQAADVSIVDKDGNTLLHLACIGGNKHIVESVLTPRNINSRSKNGCTPIMVAALLAKSDVFDLLLSQGADVSLVDEDGYTLLHLACIGGNKHIVESVLTPRNINSRSKNGCTPIMVAAANAKSDVFDLLLSQGADVSLADEDGYILLHLPCYGGNKHIVESVLTPRNINSRDKSGRTPIMVAALLAKSDVFDLLLSQGADVSLVDEDGNTLLHYACQGGNKHIVESLLTPRNINSRNKNGWTPIMVAAANAKSEVFDLLLSQGADVSLVDEDGYTLLHYACQGGNKHIVENVLTPRNINSRTKNGRTPIMVASVLARSEVFYLLLSQGADVSLVDEDGNTLLHLACGGGNKHIVESVLTPRNINSRTKNGRTPIMVAAARAKSEVFYLLLSQGADVSLVDEDGNTLLHLACGGGNKHIVESVLTPRNINSRNKGGCTPIMEAAVHAKSEVFYLLLSQGAEVSLVDKDGNTLLHYACGGGNKHIVESVLTPRNINSRNKGGCTPIMEAAVHAKSEVFYLLLSQGAEVSLVDKDGNTLLHYACGGGNKHIVESVLTPQNINSRNRDKKTPVMLAAFKGHIQIVDYLCEKGADLTCLDSDGRDVVAIAELADKKDVVKNLKNHLIQC